MKINFRSRPFVAALIAALLLGAGLGHVPGLSGALTAVTCQIVECDAVVQ